MHQNPSILTITKLDAGRRQLTTAIRLWFEDGDPVSIHTLAAAAYEVIHVVSKKQDRKEGLIFDSEFTRDEFRSEVNKAIKRVASFFKHASHDHDQEMKFNPAMSEAFFIFTILGIETMELVHTKEERAFLWWLGLHRPEVLLNEGMKSFLDGFEVEIIEQARLIPKQDFLQQFARGRMLASS